VVSLQTIILVGGIALFFLAGGGKFVSPAISSAKQAFSKGKGFIQTQTDNINSKGENTQGG